MNKQHTPGPWIIRAERYRYIQVYATLGNICHMDTVDGEGDANARRIVACVNACEGMTDEQVSHGLVSASVHSALAQQRDELLAVLDELLTAVNSLLAALDHQMDDPDQLYRAKKFARAAIARAKGE